MLWVTIKKSVMKYFYMLMMGLLTSLIGSAKEKSGEVNINIGDLQKASFLETPWVWVGIVIFLYLFLAVTRGESLKSSKP
jgi:hypothetical protein